MANHDSDRWIDERIAGLGIRNWQPNSTGAFAKLQARTWRQAPAARRWLWTTALAACAYFTLLVLPASHACAEQPGPCVLRALGVAAPPATLEVHIDRTNPECETFMREVIPQLTEFYVRQGKLRLKLKNDEASATGGHCKPFALLTANGQTQFLAESSLTSETLQSRIP